ncbi:hypothetical protein B0H11DRAFT_2198962 [Mycena galericulata]|nr:hypothetical protein B0H11DRAFT_2198962 [Mycena galericulata]
MVAPTVPRVPARLARPLHWNEAASFFLGNGHRRSHTMLRGTSVALRERYGSRRPELPGLSVFGGELRDYAATMVTQTIRRYVSKSFFPDDGRVGGAGPPVAGDGVATGKAKWRKRNHTAAVKALAWCPWQRNLLASGGGLNDGTINLWNSATGVLGHSHATQGQITVHTSHLTAKNC